MIVEKQLRFATIPEWVLFHEDLSHGAIRLYAVLDRYADKDSRDAYPSRATLAGRLGVSVKTIDRALAELVDAGAVTVEHRVDAAGDLTSNRYILRAFPPAAQPSEGGDTDVPTPSHGCPEGGVTDDATGGVTDDAGTRTTLNENPPTPASGGAGCSQHPTPLPNRRCCGTTPRQLEAKARAEQAAKRRAAEQAAIAAERAKPRGPKPGTETAKAAARRGIAQAREATIPALTGASR